MPISSTAGRSLADRLRGGAGTIRPGRGRSFAGRRRGLGLGAAVGLGRPNRPADVRTVESLLRETGDVGRSKNSPTGLFSGFLSDATLDFQRRNRLTVDGILEPDGETFGALFEETQDRLPGAPEMDPQHRERCRDIERQMARVAADIAALEIRADENERRIRQTDTDMDRVGDPEVERRLRAQLLELQADRTDILARIDRFREQERSLEARLAECRGTEIET
jgi:hypothetical protein